jgi:hypothetical protein
MDADKRRLNYAESGSGPGMSLHLRGERTQIRQSPGICVHPRSSAVARLDFGSCRKVPHCLAGAIIGLRLPPWRRVGRTPHFFRSVDLRHSAGGCLQTPRRGELRESHYPNSLGRSGRRVTSPSELFNLRRSAETPLRGMDNEAGNRSIGISRAMTTLRHDMRQMAGSSHVPQIFPPVRRAPHVPPHVLALVRRAPHDHPHVSSVIRSAQIVPQYV